jgi:hypothetical protein
VVTNVSEVPVVLLCMVEDGCRKLLRKVDNHLLDYTHTHSVVFSPLANYTDRANAIIQTTNKGRYLMALSSSLCLCHTCYEWILSLNPLLKTIASCSFTKAITFNLYVNLRSMLFHEEIVAVLMRNFLFPNPESIDVLNKSASGSHCEINPVHVSSSWIRAMYGLFPSLDSYITAVTSSG